MKREELIKLVQEARKGGHVKSNMTGNYAWIFDIDSESKVVDNFLASHPEPQEKNRNCPYEDSVTRYGILQCADCGKLLSEPQEIYENVKLFKILLKVSELKMDIDTAEKKILKLFHFESCESCGNEKEMCICEPQEQDSRELSDKAYLKWCPKCKGTVNHLKGKCINCGLTTTEQLVDYFADKIGSEQEKQTAEDEIIQPTEKEITIAYSVLAYQHKLSVDDIKTVLSKYASQSQSVLPSEIPSDIVSKMQKEFQPETIRDFQQGMYSGYAFGLQDGAKWFKSQLKQGYTKEFCIWIGYAYGFHDLSYREIDNDWVYLNKAFTLDELYNYWLTIKDK